MIGLLCLFLVLVTAPCKSKSRLEAENAALRHQLIVLRRKMQGRVRLTNSDRWFFIQLYRWFPSILNVLAIVRPETLVRWLRHILRTYAHYYNDIRTHQSLDKDAPVSRPVQRIGSVNSHAILGGLHHHYVRI
jgi:hypothetical protein